MQATSTLTYREIEEGKAFEVWQRSNQVHKVHRIRRYIVLTDLTEGKEEFSCICAKFSKDGLLCSHVLKIMIEKEISKIPDKYIIDRWRKKDMRLIKQRVEDTTVKTSSLLRFNVLSRMSTTMNSKAAKNVEATVYLMAEMERIDKHLDNLLAPPINDDSQNQTTTETQVQTEGNTENQESSSVQLLEDPQVTQKKGRPEKAKRFKTVIEQEREKAKKKETNKKKQITANANSGQYHI